MNQPETEDVKSCPSWEAEFVAWKGQYATLIGCHMTDFLMMHFEWTVFL